MLEETFEERATNLVLKKFAELPAKSKPRSYPDGSREWTPISGIVIARNRDSRSEQLTCVCVATGSKCLPQTVLPLCKGQVLHDHHAEVLALRGLNYFLLSEALHLVEHREQNEAVTFSPYVRKSQSQSQSHLYPFELCPEVSIHMFSTEAPCGDASMEVLMGDKPAQDTVPWTSVKEDGVLQGRGFFADLGVVRRKPSRPDAPPTLSKSCTDKMALKQVLSLFSFPTCLFLQPSHNAYLSSLILPQERFSTSACMRAFGPHGRMQHTMTQSTEHTYSYHPFDVSTINTQMEALPYTRPLTGKAKASNLSALWIAGPEGTGTAVNETLVNGVKQGFKQLSEDLRRCSAVSRYKMIHLAQDLVSAMKASDGNLPSSTRFCNGNCTTYDDIKIQSLASASPGRIETKMMIGKALKGWPANIGDEAWVVQRT